jgi:hypothetical protein
MWWNRRDFFNYAQPAQVTKILARRSYFSTSYIGAVGSTPLFLNGCAITRGKPTRTGHSEVA